ncbi:hypothetical protein GDO86_013572 [Hymenochirus boettgeri]|uniref:G-protein coupled receptors family 1 profile domain-containing protein n=1 Tax=Hymenochirus boettgeri TaxID=247094 RepID=A0A8T2IRW0_9PIPI|nr:hypothetical protein GDO86_013572 [Hymenochirus boettgeri]
MEDKYQGNVSDFIIQGLWNTPECQLPSILPYNLSLHYNWKPSIFFSIMFNSNLHTPMYKFLQNLSIIDISSTSNVFTCFTQFIISQENTISVFWCLTQLYLYMYLGVSEYILLTAMSYDRYVAICDPLHYITRMSEKHCAWLISTSYCVGLLALLAMLFLY